MKIFTCVAVVLALMINPASAGVENQKKSISKNNPSVGSHVNTDGKKVFHWVDDAGSPPLMYRGANGKPAGLFYRIMTEAFHRLDIPLKIEIYPWARAQKVVAEGKADGMVTVLTKKRKKLFYGTDPILLVAEHIFANKDNPRIDEIMAIRSLKELQSFKVVETIGSGWTKEALKGVDITWVPGMDSAFNISSFPKSRVVNYFY